METATNNYDGHFVVWCPRGWAHDWNNGGISFTRHAENAATWRTASEAYNVARRINGCVVDADTERLLTLAEVL